MAVNDSADLVARIDAMFDPPATEPGVVGRILPEDDPMTELGLLLRDGLPADLDPYGVDAHQLKAQDRPQEEPPVTVVTTPNGTALPVVDDCATGACQRPEEPATPHIFYAGVVPMPPEPWWVDLLEQYRAEWQIENRTLGPREHEKRADLVPLDFLLAYRAHVVHRLAPLAAMHKHEGKWDEVRRAIRGMIAAEIRKDPQKHGFKAGKEPGVEAVTDVATADPRYVHAIRRAREEAIEYERLNHELTEIDARIRAREIANLQFNAETRLQ